MSDNLTPPKVTSSNAFAFITKLDSKGNAAVAVLGTLVVLLSSPLWISPIVGVPVTQGFLFLIGYLLLSIALNIAAKARAEVLLARKYAQLFAKALKNDN